MADPGSPTMILVYMARGIVEVSPGIFPATTIVAPNSEKARPNPNNKPAMIPFNDSGNVMDIKIFKLFAPNPRAHFSSSGSTDWNATMKDLTTNGKDTNAAAKTVAIHVNDKLKLNNDSIYFPINEFDPNTQSKKYPVTTGGNAKGRELINSKRKFNLKFVLVIIHETIIPIGRINRIAKSDDLNEIIIISNSETDILTNLL